MAGLRRSTPTTPAKISSRSGATSSGSPRFAQLPEKIDTAIPPPISAAGWAHHAMYAAAGSAVATTASAKTGIGARR